MKKLLLVIAIVSLALTSCRSKEPKWVLINSDPTSYVFVEQGSIIRLSGNIAQAWFTFVSKQPQAIGRKFLQKALSRDEIDCTARRIKIVKITFYFTDGTEQSLSKELSVVDIKPGSPAEAQFNYLCKK